MPDREYVVRVVTDIAQGVPGALRIGTADVRERWWFGSYTHYWNEVANLRAHRHRLEDYAAEYDDAGGEPLYDLLRDLPARPRNFARLLTLRGRAADMRDFIAMLEGTRREVARKYDVLAAEDVLIHGLNAHVPEGREGAMPGRVVAYGDTRPADAHVAARAAEGGPA